MPAAPTYSPPSQLDLSGGLLSSISCKTLCTRSLRYSTLPNAPVNFSYPFTKHLERLRNILIQFKTVLIHHCFILPRQLLFLKWLSWPYKEKLSSGEQLVKRNAEASTNKHWRVLAAFSGCQRRFRRGRYVVRWLK